MLSRLLFVLGCSVCLLAALVSADQKSVQQPNCPSILQQAVCSQTTGCCYQDATGTCQPCNPINGAEKDALERIYTKWGVRMARNTVDNNLDTILCPRGNVSNARVYCDELGHITDLVMGNDELSGPLEEICDLINAQGTSFGGNAERIQRLFLSANRFTGSIPNCLAKCVSLKELDVTMNFLRGPVPDLSSLPLESSNTKGISGCRLNLAQSSTDPRFPDDGNCFDCPMGNLPPACRSSTLYKNDCNFLKAKPVSSCPAPNANETTPMGGPSGGNCVPGATTCDCKSGNVCNSGLTCVNGKCAVSAAWNLAIPTITLIFALVVALLM